MAEPHSRDYDLIDRLAEEFAARFRRGERPSVQEYADRYPHLADDIRELLPALVEMEQGKEELSAEAAPAPTLKQLGDFHILREVGHGGMGVVYEAEQVSLGRRVALKVLAQQTLRDAKQRRRFEREAKSAAKLHHTNIVPVYGVGEHDGTPYYVMQFIQGLGLDEVIAELTRMGPGGPTPAAAATPTRRSAAARAAARSLMTGEFAATIDGPALPEPEEALATAEKPVADASGSERLEAPVSGSGHGVVARRSDTSGLSSSVTLPGQSESGPGRKARKLTYWQSVARVGVQVADALEHAHKQGVVHRDVKPSNLLLDLEGTVWVTDFGLAKADDQQNLTHTGDILGTLRYMPPEAFDGRADARGDVYSLGLTLYELLALRPAFDESDRHRLIKQVTDTEPAALRKLKPGVPKDLETIVHKAIDREPAHRYQTAGELAADLQRFLDDDPIQARRLSNRERAWRWCRRNPAVAALTAAVALLLVAVTLASVAAAAHFDRLAREAAALADDERQAKDREAVQRQAAEDAKRLAEANFAKARAAVDDYLTKVSDSHLLKVPGMQPLRAELLGSAQAFYQDFVRERADDPSLRTDLAAALARVGAIHADLGARAEARKAYSRAIDVYEAVLWSNPASATALKDRMAAVYQGLGDLDFNTHRDQARQAYQRCVGLREELVRAEPSNVQFQKDLARAYNGIGVTARTQDRTGAFEAYRRALDIRLRLARSIPDDTRLLHGLGESLHNLGQVANQHGHREEALAMFLRGGAYNYLALARAPHVVEFALDAAITHESTATQYVALGRKAEAVAECRRGVEFLRRYLRENPAVRDMRQRVTSLMSRLARLSPDADQVDAVRGLFRDVRDLFAELPKQQPEDYLDLGRATAFYAWSLGQWRPPQTEPDKAAERAEYASALATIRQAVAAGLTDLTPLTAPGQFPPLEERDDFKALVAEAKAALPRPAAAVAAARPGPADGADRRRLEVDRATALVAVALLHGDFGQPAEAARSLAEATAAWDHLIRDEPEDVSHRLSRASLHAALGAQHWRARRLAEAERGYRTAADQLAALAREPAAGAAERAKYAAAEITLGSFYAQVGAYEFVAPHFARALDTAGAGAVLDWRLLALARLLSGDGDGYRQACARMAERYRLADGASDLTHELCAAWTIGPGGHADPERLVNLTEGYVRAAPQQRWRRFYAGLACYRAGQFEAALHWADDTWKANLPLRALACARLGKPDDARRWLAETDAAYEAEARAALRSLSAVPWLGLAVTMQDRMQYHVLRREAHETITGRPPADDPWMLLHRASVLARLQRETLAEELFAKAVAVRPEDATVWQARGLVFAQLGRDDRADADFARAAELQGADPRPFIDAGRAFAERGDHARADRMFAKAAALTPDELNRFLEAGWWVAGPYPPNLDDPCPPEVTADPARPAAAAAGHETRPWRAVPPDANGRLSILPLVPTANSSAYSLAYVYSPDERTATLLVGGQAALRAWVNGRLVFETTAARNSNWGPGPERVPVVLRQGRNTVLVRTVHAAADHFMIVRLADHPADRGLLAAQMELWPEASEEFGKALSRPALQANHYLPARHLQVLAAAGRMEEYRAGLARMLQRFGSATTRFMASDLIRASAVVPDSGADFARLAKIVEDEWLKKSDRPTWLIREVALGYYRAGQIDRAEELLKEIKPRIAAVLCKPTLALIAHGRGQAAEARALLADAEAWYAAEIDRHTTGSTLTPPAGGWALPLFATQLAEARAVLGVQPDRLPNLGAMQARKRELLVKLDPATAAFDLGVAMDRADARTLLARAHRLAELGRREQAEADFAKAVELQPNDHQVWKARGRLRAELKQWDAAAADFAKALELAPSPRPVGPGAHDPFPYAIDRSGIDDELCRWDEVFERVAKLRPTDWGLWVRRCHHFAEHARWAEAAAAVARAIEINPDYYFAWYYRATLLLEIGDQAGYRALCRAALDQFRATADRRAANQIASICALQPGAVADLGPAARLADFALAGDRSPLHGWQLATRGLIHLRAGEFDRAAERLATPPASRQPTVEAKFGAARAIMAAKRGQLDEARVAVAEAKRIIDSSCPDPARGQRYTAWVDWLHAKLFVREAEALLGQAAERSRD